MILSPPMADNNLVESICRLKTFGTLEVNEVSVRILLSKSIICCGVKSSRPCTASSSISNTALLVDVNSDTNFSSMFFPSNCQMKQNNWQTSQQSTRCLASRVEIMYIKCASGIPAGKKKKSHSSGTLLQGEEICPESK